jgi:hypothetical protein
MKSLNCASYKKNILLFEIIAVLLLTNNMQMIVENYNDLKCYLNVKETIFNLLA